jgi:hypothetical protein
VHDYNNLPVVLAGNLGGRIRSGHHWAYDGKRPLADLWMALLEAVWVKQERFADSTGILKDVLA